MTEREKIKQTIIKFFHYLDSNNWKLLMGEVLNSKLFIDCSSVGGVKKEMTSEEVCDMWKEQYSEISAVHHLSGNYLIDIVSESQAKTYLHSITTQYKEDALKGSTRQFYGTYDLNLIKTKDGWRLKSFKYLLNFIDGNVEME